MDRKREEDRSAKPDRSAEQVPVHDELLHAFRHEECGDLHEEYPRQQAPQRASVDCRRRRRPGRGTRCREHAADANDDPNACEERCDEKRRDDVEGAVVGVAVMPEQSEVRRCLDDRVCNSGGQERGREAETEPDGRPRHVRLLRGAARAYCTGIPQERGWRRTSPMKPLTNRSSRR